jgi:MYXO-CTERM domain-containing protein
MRFHKLFTILFLAFSSTHANATLLTFTFSANVDATQFGLSASAPLIIQYTYDTAQVGNIITPNNVIYPTNFSFMIGSDNIQASYGGINTRTPPSYAYAQFDLSDATYAIIDGVHSGQFTGNLNGYAIDTATFNLINQVPPITMLSSNSLPGSAAFISAADFIGVDIENLSGVKIIKQFAPGTFTFTATSPVPEPSAGLLALAGLVALGMLRLSNKWRSTGTSSLHK